MAAHAIAVIARSARLLWFVSLAMLKPQTLQKALSRGRTTADREAALRHYSFKYCNGTQTIQDMRDLEFSSDRAARREALRTARDMADDVSWKASARGGGWTVVVTNPIGQQICEVSVRPKKRWF